MPASERDYIVAMKVEVTATTVRQAAEVGGDDLHEHLSRRRATVTVTDTVTGVETCVDLSDPVSGQELEYERRLQREGR